MDAGSSQVVDMGKIAPETRIRGAHICLPVCFSETLTEKMDRRYGHGNDDRDSGHGSRDHHRLSSHPDQDLRRRYVDPGRLTSRPACGPASLKVPPPSDGLDTGNCVHSRVVGGGACAHADDSFHDDNLQRKSSLGSAS